MADSTIDFAIFPPPIKKVTRLYSEADTTIPGNFHLDVHGRLLKSYLTYEGVAGPLIESYNDWIYNKLPKQLASRIVTTADGNIVRIVRASLYRPSIGTSSGQNQRLLPYEARDRQLTYEARMYADFVKQTPDGRVLETSNNVAMGTIPVMLGSALCHLSEMTDTERYEVHECPKDPLGYFIIKGSEKVILLQEKLRYNRMFVFFDSKQEWDVCKMTVTVPTGTSAVELIYFPEMKTKEPFARSRTIGVHLYYMGSKEKKPNTIPLFSAFRLLGVSDVATIVKMIMTFVQEGTESRGNRRRRVLHVLQPTIAKYLATADDTAELARARLEEKLPYEERYTAYVKGLREELYAHLPAGTSDLHRLWMLAMQAARLAEKEAGLRKYDDRDGWDNKRIQRGSDSMWQLYHKILKAFFTATQAKVNEERASSLDAVIRHLETKVLISSFVDSFSPNNWGSGTGFIKENITEILVRFSMLSVYSHLTRTNTPTSRKAKNPHIRYAWGSQLGMICPTETPEGGNCGLIKNVATTTYLSIDKPDQENMIKRWMASPYVLPSGEQRVDHIVSPLPAEGKKSPCMLNGKLLGWCNAEALRDLIINLRRRRELEKDIYAVIETDGILYIHTDGERPTRPLLIVNKDGKLVIAEKNLWGADWAELIRQGCVEYVDAHEQAHIMLAQSIWSMEARANEIKELTDTIQDVEERLARIETSPGREIVEYIQLMSGERKEIRITQEDAMNTLEQLRFTLRDLETKSANRPFTHCELDPSAILGFTAAMIPFPDRNLAPRNVYACSQMKQGISVYHSNHTSRFDTSAKVLAFPSKPLFDTQMSDLLGISELPPGQMILVAITTYLGLNQEDAIILNEDSVNNGLFWNIKYFTKRSILRNSANQFTERHGRPTPKRNESPEIYSAIQENGLPIKGAMIRRGMCIIGKIRTYTQTGDVENASEMAGVGESGIVSDILVTKNGEGKEVIVVKLAMVRKPIRGDKFNQRNAQKQTAVILPANKMPTVKGGPYDGIKPDAIINPHALISRMTMTTFIEILASKVAAMKGERVNATAFRTLNIEEFKRQLKEYGYNEWGNERMISGITGREMEADIFFGPIFYQASRHQVGDKIQQRGKGALNPLSGQPVRGRKAEGGLRFGEMERDSIISHGAMGFLADKMCSQSDAYKPVYCSTCGYRAIADALHQRIICRRCGSDARFGTMTMPFIFNYLSEVLAGMNFGISLGVTTRRQLVPMSQPTGAVPLTPTPSTQASSIPVQPRQ